MKVISVGPDDLSFDGEKGFTWIVYHYDTDGNDGSGRAYGFKDGKLHEMYLGHCSCNGPMDDGWSEVNTSRFMDTPTIFDDELDRTVAELLKVVP